MRRDIGESTEVAMENAPRVIKKEIQDRKEDFGEKEVDDWLDSPDTLIEG